MNNYNPNARQKLLNTIQSLDTDTLVDLLKVVPPNRIDQGQLEDVKKALSTDPDRNSEDLPMASKTERNVKTEDDSAVVSDLRKHYTAGYSPKAHSGPGRAGAKSAEVSERPKLEAGKSPGLNIKHPEIQQGRTAKKMLEDEGNSSRGHESSEDGGFGGNFLGY